MARLVEALSYTFIGGVLGVVGGCQLAGGTLSEYGVERDGTQATAIEENGASGFTLVLSKPDFIDAIPKDGSNTQRVKREAARVLFVSGCSPEDPKVITKGPVEMVSFKVPGKADVCMNKIAPPAHQATG